jgi:hypothetical protein
MERDRATKKSFAKKLSSVYDLNVADVLELANFSQELMKLFLQFGSETPDNLNCFSHIEYGKVEKDLGYEYGFKVKNKNISVVNIINYVESLNIPEEIREAFPELTPDEWSAITRISTMVVLAFSRWGIKDSED